MACMPWQVQKNIQSTKHVEYSCMAIFRFSLRPDPATQRYHTADSQHCQDILHIMFGARLYYVGNGQETLTEQ